MSSQASSAGRDEAKVRQKLIETGDVDVMIAIRSNFFYTRTVPCELWFLNRAKPAAQKDKVLMLDARNVYTIQSDGRPAFFRLRFDELHGLGCFEPTPNRGVGYV